MKNDILHDDGTISRSSGSDKVAELYNSGNNCEKAVMKVLQQVLNLPIDRFDWSDFYSEKPDDTDRFVCKAVIAGVLGIYLKIVHDWEVKSGRSFEWNVIEESRLAMELFNKMLCSTSGEKTSQFENFNPFSCDARFNCLSERSLTELYQNEVALFLQDFSERFHKRDCIDILGFDPFSYEDYDSKTQEEIESGEWMKKCLSCMQHVVTYFHRHNIEL